MASLKFILSTTEMIYDLSWESHFQIFLFVDVCGKWSRNTNAIEIQMYWISCSVFVWLDHPKFGGKFYYIEVFETPHRVLQISKAIKWLLGGIDDICPFSCLDHTRPYFLDILYSNIKLNITLGISQLNLFKSIFRIKILFSKTV